MVTKQSNMSRNIISNTFAEYHKMLRNTPSPLFISPPGLKIGAGNPIHKSQNPWPAYLCVDYDNHTI